MYMSLMGTGFGSFAYICLGFLALVAGGVAASWKKIKNSKLYARAKASLGK